MLNVALQGGGSYGAFSWGVLDRLLEDERIGFEGLSGASAGAMNAAVFAQGFTTGGRDGAREALERFWHAVADSPPVASLAFLSPFVSPSQLNPLNRNPLRELLLAQIDFERLKGECKLKLFVSTTSVRTGMARIFRTDEITVDVLLASACLPQLQHTVHIDGEAYWDGGLTANPPVRPLIYECDARDVLVVVLQPGPRPDVPLTAQGIQSRLAEIGLSAPLFSELEGIGLAKREASRWGVSFGSLERKLRRLNVHLLHAPENLNQLSMLSRLNTHSIFIKSLYDAGRREAEGWLGVHFGCNVDARPALA